MEVSSCHRHCNVAKGPRCCNALLMTLGVHSVGNATDGAVNREALSSFQR